MRRALVPRTLRHRLRQLELNVTQAAEMVGLARPSFSKILNGTTGLTVQTAFRIGARFGLDARQLLIDQLEEEIERHKKKIAPSRQRHEGAV